MWTAPSTAACLGTLVTPRRQHRDLRPREAELDGQLDVGQRPHAVLLAVVVVVDEMHRRRAVGQALDVDPEVDPGGDPGPSAARTRSCRPRGSRSSTSPIVPRRTLACPSRPSRSSGGRFSPQLADDDRRPAAVEILGQRSCLARGQMDASGQDHRRVPAKRSGVDAVWRGHPVSEHHDVERHRRVRQPGGDDPVGHLDGLVPGGW